MNRIAASIKFASELCNSKRCFIVSNLSNLGSPCSHARCDVCQLTYNVNASSLANRYRAMIHLAVQELIYNSSRTYCRPSSRMAGNRKQQTLSQCAEDLAQCSICFEQMENPRALPCLHTFCLKCIEDECRRVLPGGDQSSGGDVPCPLCRRRCHLSVKKAEQLPVNFFVKNLLDTRAASSRNMHQPQRQDTPISSARRKCSIFTCGIVVRTLNLQSN